MAKNSRKPSAPLTFDLPESLIARIWGVSPNSYPCLNGHSYDRAVTPEYFKVVTTGEAPLMGDMYHDELDT